jgi:hypothetical protein
MGLFDDVGAALKDHGVKIALSVGGVAAGALWGRWRARRKWARREFLDRLNVSLNTLENGWLRLRTLLEKDAQEVFLNQTAVRMVQEAAGRCTEADPILDLPADDAWFVLNGVLNEISEKFADGLLRRDMGLPVTGCRYLMCLTFEVAGSVRTRKVRAMLVRKDVLEALPAECPKLESPNHVTRWSTLQAMAKAWDTRRHLFQELELLA